MTDQIKILYAEEIQLLGFGESDSGGPWIKLRLADPAHLDYFRPHKGEPLLVSFGIPPTEAPEEEPEKPTKGIFGQYWKQLMAGWNVEGNHVFLTDYPDVLALVGTDKEFLDWLKTEKCCVDHEPHQGDIVPAHVRRVNKGAGTGIKPPYSAVPMCNDAHQLQHQKGESAIGGREFMDKQAAHYRAKWFYTVLKKRVNVQSMSAVDPKKFQMFLGDLHKYIPAELIV